LPDVDSNLVSIGDANLRQDLADSASGSGASLVSMEGGPTVEDAVLYRVIRVPSVTALKGNTQNAQLLFFVESRLALGDNGGGFFKWDSSDLQVPVSYDVSESRYVAPTSDATGASGAFVKIYGNFNASFTVGIPSMYSTLQLAFSAIAQLIPVNEAQITLLIESGHAPASGLSVVNGKYSHILVSSEDATVTVDATYDDVFISSFDSTAPVLNCLVDANNLGSTGYDVNRGTGEVRPDCGVINSGFRGLQVRSGIVYANDTLWTGATTDGVRASHTAKIYCAGADASNAGGSGIFCSRESEIHGDMSGSSAGRPLKANNSVIYGLRAIRARISANGAEAKNCSHGAYATLNGGIAADDIDVSGSGYGLFAGSGSLIVANDAIATGCTTNAIYCAGLASITAGDISAENAGQDGIFCSGGNVAAGGVNSDFSGAGGYAIFSQFGGIVSAVFADLTDATNSAVFAEASTIYLEGADTSGNGDHCIEALHSRIIAQDMIGLLSASTTVDLRDACNCDLVGANLSSASAAKNIQVLRGSICAANNATLAGPTNITANTLSAAGIIFI
jgi:hypothetical protein